MDVGLASGIIPKAACVLHVSATRTDELKAELMELGRRLSNSYQSASKEGALDDEELAEGDGGKLDAVLVLEGGVLDALGQPEMTSTFLSLALACTCVLCCR